MVARLRAVSATWLQKLEDRQDAAAQAEVEGIGAIGTQAVCSVLPAGRAQPVGVQKGRLRLARDAVSWEHGPSSTMMPVTIGRAELKATSVGSRGLFWRRGSLILDTERGSAIFVTTARFDRLLQGVEQLGYPAPRLATE
ncbi:MAG: hypothetical protein M3066_05480 [Actinomycetota bacterium]|nr:hypothetical protein [Actinomycetota bacterium]